MQKSGYVLQNFALFVNLGKVKDAWQEVQKLRALYKEGVRMMTLSWNYKNELGHPNLYAELRNSIRAEEPHLTPEEQDYALQKYLNTPDTEHGLTKKAGNLWSAWRKWERLWMFPICRMRDFSMFCR